MSLIEEALRRVPDPSASKGGATTASQPPQTAAQEPTAHSWPTAPPSPLDAPRPLSVAAVAILGLTGALLLGGIVWFGRTLRATPPAPEAASASSAAQAASAATQGQPAAAKKSAWYGGSAADQEMILSGIVVGIGEPYAVINGEIFARGDRIGNATLLEIAQDAVTVRLPNGKETVLRIPR